LASSDSDSRAFDFGQHEDRTPTHGYAEAREAAMAAAGIDEKAPRLPAPHSRQSGDESNRLGSNFRLRMAGCFAQCLNLEYEIHQTASKLCILGFEPLE
jgi:hypothetical protein